MKAQTAVIVALLAFPAPAASDEPSRLLVDSPQLAATIDAGSQRSPTFRSIVDRLEKSKVVVYVRYGTCDSHVDACLAYVAWSAPFLYVRATIDPRGKPQCVIVGWLAHELRHAFELADGGVTTPEQFAAFYEKHGSRLSNGYETEEASRAGLRAEWEFRSFHEHR